jgi:hypothetical protein
MIIRPMGAELFHADVQTERYEETKRRFSQFCENSLKTHTAEKNRSRILLVRVSSFYVIII